MAVRQYIGARYVTKIYENSLDPFSAEWEAGVTYEPLTLVTYLNSSYLSKKEVPGSIGDPAANPSYWVVTGAYNGQIAQLQSQVSVLNTIVDTLTNKKLAIITDSYGTVETAWMSNIADQMGLTLEDHAVGGMGFVKMPSGLNKTFIDLLDDLDPDSVYDTLLVYGGQNDIGESSASITAAVSAFITKAHLLLPNTKIYICGPQSSVTTLTGTNSGSLAACEEAIQRGCNAIGGVAYCNPANWLSNAPDGFGWYYASDNTHPNSDGYKVIEINLLNLLNGNLMSECNKQFTFTATNYVATDLNVYAAVDHNKIHFDGTAKAAAELTAGSDYIFMGISNNLYAFIALGNERAILRVYKVVGGRYTFVGCMRPGGTSGNRNYRFTPDVTINANEDLFLEGDIYMNSRHQ